MARLTTKRQITGSIALGVFMSGCRFVVGLEVVIAIIMGLPLGLRIMLHLRVLWTRVKRLIVFHLRYWRLPSRHDGLFVHLWWQLVCKRWLPQRVL